jgi:hypothetical protein
MPAVGTLERVIPERQMTRVSLHKIRNLMHVQRENRKLRLLIRSFRGSCLREPCETFHSTLPGYCRTLSCASLDPPEIQKSTDSTDTASP